MHASRELPKRLKEMALDVPGAKAGFDALVEQIILPDLDACSSGYERKCRVASSAGKRKDRDSR